MNVLGSLTRKFLLVGIVTFIYIAALIFSGLTYSVQHAGDAARINLAGQMRYRTYEISWLAHQLFEEATEPGAARTQSQVRDDLLEKIRELDAVMTTVRDGRDDINLRPLGSEDHRERFNRIFAEWNERFRPDFLSMARLQADAPKSEPERLHARVDSRIQAFVSTINDFVAALQQDDERSLARLNYFGSVAAGLFLLVGAIIVYFLRQTIVLPVQRLHAAALALDAGNYDIRLAVKNRDELGDLGHSYNQMAETLKSLLAEMQERMRELEVLNNVAQAANRSLTLDTQLDQVLEYILELDALKLQKKGAIFLVAEQGRALTLAASCHFSDEQKAGCARVPFGDCLCGIVGEGGEAILSTSSSHDARHVRCFSGQHEHGHIILPLKTPQGMVGVICLYQPAQVEVSARTRAVFQAIADIVAVSVQNALGHRQMAMLAQSLESSQDMVIIANLAGKILHVNPAATGHTGYPREELVGREISLLVSPRNPGGQLLDIIRETMADGWCGEVLFSRKEGSDYPVQLTTSAVRGRDGGLIALVALAKDVTERKAADERLRESEARFRRLAENAEDIIYTIRFVPRLCFDYVNPAVSRITGYTPEDYYSDPELAASIIMPVDREFRACRENKDLDAIRFILFRWLKKDGQVVWTEQRNVPICDEAGNLVAIQGIARDITEKRQAEQYMEEARNRLLEAQRIARLGNWDWDLINDRVYCSDEVDRIFGFEVGECVWSFRDILGSVHPGDRARVQAEVTGAIASGRPFRSEHRIVQRDGAVRNVLQQGECEQNAEGKPTRTFGTIQDITERKQLEEQLREYSEQLEKKIQERTRELELAKEAAEAASRAKSEFLANMSHELRTPLNSVLGFAGLVADGLAGPVTETQQEYLRDVIDSANHLLSLINDVLDLSKVEAGRTELDYGEFGFKDLVHSALLMFREKAFRHALQMTSQVEEGIGVVNADERLIKQVLYNVLSNAVKFTPEGGRIHVSARLVRPASDGEEGSGTPGIPLLEVSVEDSGIGIAAKDQQKLFQPFQQVDTTLTKQYSGTGLGLSLCKRFVELHGGTIGLRSEPGRGSTFTFSIPIRPPGERAERVGE